MGMRHAFANPRRYVGVSKNAQLTFDKAQQIRQAVNGGATRREMALQYGVSLDVINRIIQGVSYNYPLTDKVPDKH